MRRRGLLAAGLAPAVAQAQRRLPIVGFFAPGSEAADEPGFVALRRGLAEQGLIEGRTIQLERRQAAGDPSLAAAQLQALLALPVDVFVVPGPAAARMARRASAIPVVAIALPPVASDPELFQSLARPGGSVTGFAAFGEAISAKRVELLRELMPEARAIGVLHNGTDPTFDAWGLQTETDARARGLEVLRLPLASGDPATLAATLDRAQSAGVVAVIVVRDFLMVTLMPAILRETAARGIAVVAEERANAEAGALFSYGADMPDLFRRAAGYVARILKGEKPGELPVQLPTAMQFVINSATAQRLGIAVPPAILARADAVID